MAPKTSAKTKEVVETSKTPKPDVSLTKAQQNKVNGLPTVSARIRYLDSEAFTRSQITKLITNATGGVLRYQHVRNVLVTEVAKPKS